MINFNKSPENKTTKQPQKSPAEEDLERMDREIKAAIDSGSDPHFLTRRRNELLGKIKASKGISQ